MKNHSVRRIHKDGSVEILTQSNTLAKFVEHGVLFNQDLANALKIPASATDDNCKIYCRLIDTMGHASWGIASAEQNKKGNLFFDGVCSLFDVEYGGFSLSELLEVNEKLGWNRIQIDVSYTQPLTIREYTAYVRKELEFLGKI